MTRTPSLKVSALLLTALVGCATGAGSTAETAARGAGGKADDGTTATAASVLEAQVARCRSDFETAKRLLAESPEQYADSDLFPDEEARYLGCLEAANDEALGALAALVSDTDRDPSVSDTDGDPSVSDTDGEAHALTVAAAVLREGQRGLCLARTEALYSADPAQLGAFGLESYGCDARAEEGLTHLLLSFGDLGGTYSNAETQRNADEAAACFATFNESLEYVGGPAHAVTLGESLVACVSEEYWGPLGWIAGLVAANYPERANESFQLAGESFGAFEDGAAAFCAELGRASAFRGDSDIETFTAKQCVAVELSRGLSETRGVIPEGDEG